MSTGGGWGGGAPQGPPQGPPGGYQPQGPQPQSPSGMAVFALICGIGSWVVLPFVAAIAGLIVGKMELGKIERGEAPEAGRTFAQIGYWASIANIIVSVLALLGTCCFFGLMFMGIFGASAAAGAG